VTSALTDLLPYTIIAAEQSVTREDFSEAQRLTALIERTDAHAPALPRLKQSIANAQTAASKRTAEETAKAQQQARQQEEQRQSQQRAEQQRAAEAIAKQQEADRTKAATTTAAPPPVQQPAIVQQPASAPQQSAPPPQQAAVAASTALQVISQPQPHYPADAWRTGTSGEVIVELTVGTDGSVTNARVVRSTPARVFDREAVNAARRWKFAPISEPVTTRRTITFNP
jgi:protein TonB